MIKTDLLSCLAVQQFSGLDECSSLVSIYSMYMGLLALQIRHQIHCMCHECLMPMSSSQCKTSKQKADKAKHPLPGLCPNDSVREIHNETCPHCQNLVLDQALAAQLFSIMPIYTIVKHEQANARPSVIFELKLAGNMNNTELLGNAVSGAEAAGRGLRKFRLPRAVRLQFSGTTVEQLLAAYQVQCGPVPFHRKVTLVHRFRNLLPHHDVTRMRVLHLYIVKPV